MRNFWLFFPKAAINVYNFFILLLKNKKVMKSDNEDINQIRDKAKKLTDINEHLETIYNLTVKEKPKFIVELGVRGGESTFVFEKAAKRFDAYLLSVDIEDIDFYCGYSKWIFFKGDDIQLGKSFLSFVKEKKLPEKIDVLFIDTSHRYDHTVLEIETWFPYLSDNGLVIFHDTNISTIFKRKDGTIGGGWNNNRGVIRAIEEYFKTEFNEKEDFRININGFQVIHYSYCNGLTVLKKIN
jgi:cephalosporin hydroxylase